MFQLLPCFTSSAQVQPAMLNDSHVRNTLFGLYRLHEWEDGEAGELEPRPVDPNSDPNAAVSAVTTAGVTSSMERDPLLALELVRDNLDCLFVRLRENPSLFAARSSLPLVAPPAPEKTSKLVAIALGIRLKLQNLV